MLKAQLRELESNGFVLRAAYAKVPPRVNQLRRVRLQQHIIIVICFAA